MDTPAQDRVRLADVPRLAPEPAGARWLVLRAARAWTFAIPWMAPGRASRYDTRAPRRPRQWSRRDDGSGDFRVAATDRPGGPRSSVRHPQERGGERHVSAPMLTIHNRHSAACGIPPALSTGAERVVRRDSRKRSPPGRARVRWSPPRRLWYQAAASARGWKTTGPRCTFRPTSTASPRRPSPEPSSRASQWPETVVKTSRSSRPAVSVPPASRPDSRNCHGECVSFLAGTYGGMANASLDLGFATVADLQAAIHAFCGDW